MGRLLIFLGVLLVAFAHLVTIITLQSSLSTRFYFLSVAVHISRSTPYSCTISLVSYHCFEYDSTYVTPQNLDGDKPLLVRFRSISAWQMVFELTFPFPSLKGQILGKLYAPERVAFFRYANSANLPIRSPVLVEQKKQWAAAKSAIAVVPLPDSLCKTGTYMFNLFITHHDEL